MPDPTDQELLSSVFAAAVSRPGVPTDEAMAEALEAYEDQPLPALPDRRVLTDPPPLSLEQERFLREWMRMNGLTAGDFNDAGLSPRALLTDHGDLDADKTAAAIYHLRTHKWA